MAGSACGFERGREVQHGILGQDGVLQPGHVVPRLDPQLVDQDGPQVPEHPQRLGLPAAAVERQHALRPQSLAHGVGARQRFQLARDRFVPAHGELGVNPRLGGQQPQLLQAPRFGPGERFVADLAVGRPRQSPSASESSRTHSGGCRRAKAGGGPLPPGVRAGKRPSTSAGDPGDSPVPGSR